MINPAPYVRQAFFALLNEAVTYNGNDVPVFENEGMHGLPAQILIAEQTWNDRSTKHSFTGNFSQLIEVVTESKGTSGRKAVDEIGGQVMHLVQPGPRSTGLVETQFQIIGLKKESQNYLSDEGQAGTKIVRLLIRYIFIVNQINL